MSEKLDDFNKILLATSTINYMASACNGVLMQMKFINNKVDGEDINDPIEETIASSELALSRVVSDLCAVLESFGNFLDGKDCVCHIDTRVYKAPLEILLHGMDDVEKDYDDDQEAQN